MRRLVADTVTYLIGSSLFQEDDPIDKLEFGELDITSADFILDEEAGISHRVMYIANTLHIYR